MTWLIFAGLMDSVMNLHSFSIVSLLLFLMKFFMSKWAIVTEMLAVWSDLISNIFLDKEEISSEKESSSARILSLI